MYLLVIMKAYKEIWQNKAVHQRLREFFRETLSGKAKAKVRHDFINSAYLLARNHKPRSMKFAWW
jgi:hypothetical protein